MTEEGLLTQRHSMNSVNISPDSSVSTVTTSRAKSRRIMIPYPAGDNILCFVWEVTPGYLRFYGTCCLCLHSRNTLFPWRRWQKVLRNHPKCYILSWRWLCRCV